MAKGREDFDCWSWFRHRKSKTRTSSTDLNPVLLVPGIAGSILNAVNKKNGSTERVWVRIFLASCEFKKKLWSIYNPATGYAEALDPNIKIEVPDDDNGLYAIDMLDPSWLPKVLHMSELYYFHDMIDMLLDCGYEKGVTLFGYGYDFRQSNRTTKSMDGFKKRLETAYKSSGGKKVNIISHSMGGLLVKCFLSLHQDMFEKYVNTWIAIACPFQGCPGFINDCLLTGMQFIYGLESYLFISRWTMHQLLVECPSVYEMMTSLEFKWKKLPLIKVWSKRYTREGEAYTELESFGPKESISIFEEALKDNMMTYNGKSIPLPFNLSIFKHAQETHQILNAAQLPGGIKFYNIFGISIDSPFDVYYGTETAPINNLQEICTSKHQRICIWLFFSRFHSFQSIQLHFSPQYSYVDGDGTVPAESAKADGLNAMARIGIPGTHRDLMTNESVFQLLKQWLGVVAPTQSYDSLYSYSIITKPIECVSEDSDTEAPIVYITKASVNIPLSWKLLKKL